MRKLVLGALALFTASTLALPAVAGSKFWVSNQSDYQIHDVFVAQDTSGGARDLLGPNGVIPSWDQAKTLRPWINGCYSDVAVVNEYNNWHWFYDVDVCNPATRVEVYNSDFFD